MVHIIYELMCRENFVGDMKCAALLKRLKTTGVEEQFFRFPLYATDRSENK
jgi:hypothetical protein